MDSRIVRASLYGLGLALVAVCMSATLSAAQAAPTPEIDGGTVSTGLAGLAGAVLILRARRRSK
jgi:hypothetical protein